MRGRSRLRLRFVWMSCWFRCYVMRMVGWGKGLFVGVGWEVVGLELAVVAGLPVLAGLWVEAGEPAVAVGPGVDAEGVAEVEDLAVFLGGVAADHAASGGVWFGVVEVLPVEGVGVLLLEGEFGVCVGVDVEVVVEFVVGLAVGDEVPVGGGDVVEVFGLVGLEGGVAAVVEPGVEVADVLACFEHHDFMVAEEWDEGGALLELDEVLDDVGGVWAAVDVVAEGDDDVVVVELEVLVERLQGWVAAMDVADGEGSHGCGFGWWVGVFVWCLGFDFFACAGVGDEVFFAVEGGVGAEGHACLVFAFEFDEDLVVAGAEALHDVWVDDDGEVAVGFAEALEDGAEAALDFDAHGEWGFDLAVAGAVLAGFVEGVGEAFVEALACHFHEAELGDGEDLCFGFVAAGVFDHGLVDGLLVAALFHVDEVDDDEAAHVAEAELACDFCGGFEVGFEDDFVVVGGFAFVASGVDVDGDEGFGLVDDDVAAAFEPDFAVEGGVDLALDIVFVEDGAWAGEVGDAAEGAFGDGGDDFFHALDDGDVVAGDFVDVVGEEVADGAFEDVWFFKAADGDLFAVAAFDDFVPLFDEDGEVADDVACAFACGFGAHDDAHAVWEVEFFDDFA